MSFLLVIDRYFQKVKFLGVFLDSLIVTVAERQSQNGAAGRWPYKSGHQQWRMLAILDTKLTEGHKGWIP